jgi:hypothetical protein
MEGKAEEKLQGFDGSNMVFWEADFIWETICISFFQKHIFLILEKSEYNQRYISVMNIRFLIKLY